MPINQEQNQASKLNTALPGRWEPGVLDFIIIILLL